jgi:hypothetical protein
MKQIDFFAKKKYFALVNRLIGQCNVKRLWYFWGKAELVYFQVGGTNEDMASFNEQVRKFEAVRSRK